MAKNYVSTTAPFNGVSPQIQRPIAFIGQGAVVLGRTTLGRGAWLDDFAVIRADGHFVEIGDDFYLGEHGTVHIAHDIYPTRIGDRVSVGSRAIVHACDVADDCVIEREAIVLDGSKIGSGAILSAGSVVFPRSELDGGWLYAGSPAKPVSRVTREQLETHHLKLRNEKLMRPIASSLNEHEKVDVFIAPSASVSGNIRCGTEASIWYGCHLTSGQWHIDIGERTNVQDNSFVVCENADVKIGQDVTIGHNVTLIDCQIEANSLIGMGSVISPGTIVESDVLVAAGSETDFGQRLTGGQIWAGKPARPIGKMDARKRQMLLGTLPVYCSYARHFSKTTHQIID
jgi:carbonic anhydrase/acetyltransferase-like protein (isoleucine patch superfamily)